MKRLFGKLFLIAALAAASFAHAGITPGVVDLTARASAAAAASSASAAMTRAQSSAPDYVSTDQTVTSAGALTLAHGLGGAPSMMVIELVCQSADDGYAAGDVITTSAIGINTGGGGLAVWMDATNIYIRFSNLANAFSYPNKATGTVTNLVNASWKLRVKAWY